MFFFFTVENKASCYVNLHRNFGKREVWVRLMLIAPKCNNGSLIHYYVWVRLKPIIPKYNNRSLLHCYVWVQQMPIVPKLHVYPKCFNLPFRLLQTKLTKFCAVRNA